MGFNAIGLIDNVLTEVFELLELLLIIVGWVVENEEADFVDQLRVTVEVPEDYD